MLPPVCCAELIFFIIQDIMKGILLVNLGSPKDLDLKSIKNYLREFLSDELVIETELEVQDIISISLGQNARVSFSAYDPGIYGYLNASVEKIGIDTQQRDDGSYYYPVRVKTKSRKFDRGNKEADFVPGMMASVEIIGEARTVAQYMLSRFEVARRSAFTEK